LGLLTTIGLSKTWEGDFVLKKKNWGGGTEIKKKKEESNPEARLRPDNFQKINVGEGQKSAES